MEREKLAEKRRMERDQKLKEKISEYQMLKMQKEKIEAEKNREEAEKRAQREELRQQYFDMQRKNIEDFKL